MKLSEQVKKDLESSVNMFEHGWIIGRIELLEAENAALKRENIALDLEKGALEEYFNAHMAFEDGLASFDLHNAAVERLEQARDVVRALLEDKP